MERDFRGGIEIKEQSMGDMSRCFIMSVNRDKIEQLLRECHKDRPKIEVDLNLIGNELPSEDVLKKREEDRRRSDEERIRKCRISLLR